MFKWPGSPSHQASGHEIADYAELVCWRDGAISTTAIASDLGRLADNDYSAGVPEDNPEDEVVASATAEIDHRIKASRAAYPFSMSNEGYTISVALKIDDPRHTIYRYLLLSTRMNMQTSRVYANLDGTHLLEELSAEVARAYFGDRTESLVFGTAAVGAGFADKVNDLCDRIKEGGGFIDRSGGASSVRDGKLDVVAWKHFADLLPGKIIAFGQCKTGTNYKDELSQLQPDSFCRKWLQSPLAFEPVRMFFISEALPSNLLFDFASDGGLLFDRCRILDFSENLSSQLLTRIYDWTQGAAAATGLPV